MPYSSIHGRTGHSGLIRTHGQLMFQKTTGPDVPSLPDFSPWSCEIGVNGLGRANIVHKSDNDVSFSHNFNFSASEEFGGFVVNEMRV